MLSSVEGLWPEPALLPAGQLTYYGTPNTADQRVIKQYTRTPPVILTDSGLSLAIRGNRGYFRGQKVLTVRFKCRSLEYGPGPGVLPRSIQLGVPWNHPDSSIAITDVKIGILRDVLTNLRQAKLFVPLPGLARFKSLRAIRSELYFRTY